jgi:hypothetical protein
MAASKYMTIVSGIDTLIAANQTSAGAGDAGKLMALNSSGLLDVTMLPVGVGPDVKAMVTSENLAVGAIVNVYNVAGVATARNADDSNSRQAMGYVLAATTSPAVATVYFTGINNQLSGLVPGARQYLSTVGAISSTPATSGIHQYVGEAISATELQFVPDDYVVL